MAQLKPPLSDRDHQTPAEPGALQLVEFGDFQCPHCAKAAPVVLEIRQTLGQRLKFAYRHFPLTKMHPLAMGAALAVEAVARQQPDLFWSMYDWIFTDAANLAPQVLRQYAQTNGLDMGQFDSDLADDSLAQRIREDVSSGIRSGVNGTPTFFINGQRHNGSNSLEALLEVIQSAASE